MAKKTVAPPDILEPVYYLNGEVKDPAQRLRLATEYADATRDLFRELAHVRRISAVEARRKIIDEGKESGITAAEATRQVAEASGVSVQTVNRLTSERNQYAREQQ